MERLAPLASEAETLRQRQAKAAKFADSLRRREQSIQEARQTGGSRGHPPGRNTRDLLNEAAQAVSLLFAAMKDVSNKRRRAAEALAIVDRVDYDVELAETGEEEIAMNRDPRGLAYALASRHGDVKVQQLLEDMDPGFHLLRNCKPERFAAPRRGRVRDRARDRPKVSGGKGAFLGQHRCHEVRGRTRSGPLSKPTSRRFTDRLHDK